MHIIPTSKNFEVYFDYNKNINAALKQMKGQYRAAYGSKDNHWIVPLAYEDALMKLLGKYQKPNSVAGLPQVTGVIPPMPELEIDIPLLRPLYHYQQQGTAQMLKFKRCINGDQPGLGKSQEAIAACVGAGSKCILVICPSSLRINWQKEFMMVAGMKSIILTDAIKKTWHCYHETGTCKVFITNYESLEKYFVQEINRDPKKKTFRQEDIIFKSRIYDFDTVIIDEIHRCKDPTTQVSKFVYGVCDKKEYIFGLSGTPVVNKTKDLISLLTIIRKMGNMTGQKTIQEASKWFLNRYCGGEAANQNTNSAELQYKLLTTCYFQREKKDVLKDLPDLSRQIIKCEITNQKEYDFALRNLETYLKEFKNKTDEETKKSMNGEIMVRIQVLKQIAARGKIEAASEIVDEIIDAGRKIVIVIHHKEIAEELFKVYPHAVKIVGNMDEKEVEKNKELFQTDPRYNIMVISSAGKEGHTLTAASDLLLIELPWHSAQMDQYEARVHRNGQTKGVVIKALLGEGTIDEHIYDIIEKKRKVAGEITGSTDNVLKEIFNFYTQKAA